MNSQIAFVDWAEGVQHGTCARSRLIRQTSFAGDCCSFVELSAHAHGSFVKRVSLEINVRLLN